MKCSKNNKTGWWCWCCWWQFCCWRGGAMTGHQADSHRNGRKATADNTTVAEKSLFFREVTKRGSEHPSRAALPLFCVLKVDLFLLSANPIGFLGENFVVPSHIIGWQNSTGGKIQTYLWNFDAVGDLLRKTRWNNQSFWNPFFALRKWGGFFIILTAAIKEIAAWIRPAFASFSQIPRDGSTVEIRAKGKNFNISYNLNILAFLPIKLVQILFKQIARNLFGMIFWKKKFSILKFSDQLLIHIKTKLFFSIKIVQGVAENASQWWKYLRIPPSGAGRIAFIFILFADNGTAASCLQGATDGVSYYCEGADHRTSWPEKFVVLCSKKNRQ